VARLYRPVRGHEALVNASADIAFHDGRDQIARRSHRSHSSMTSGAELNASSIRSARSSEIMDAETCALRPIATDLRVEATLLWNPRKKRYERSSRGRTRPCRSAGGEARNWTAATLSDGRTTDAARQRLTALLELCDRQQRRRAGGQQTKPHRVFEALRGTICNAPVEERKSCPTRFMPTSTTTAPRLIILPLIRIGRPTATTRMSASRVIAPSRGA